MFLKEKTRSRDSFLSTISTDGIDIDNWTISVKASDFTAVLTLHRRKQRRRVGLSVLIFSPPIAGEHAFFEHCH